MNINDMYQICQYAINKAQNGYLTPSQFNLLANQAQTSYQDYLLGEFQQYQYGRPQAKVNYSQNSDTRQRLTPFILSATLDPDADGLVDYPTDTITKDGVDYEVKYLQTDSMLTEDFDRIRFVQQDSLYSYLKSEIDPIATNSIYLLKETGFQFYPNTTDNDVSLSNIKLTYVVGTPIMTWAYTLDGNGRAVFAPTQTGVGVTPTTGTAEPLWYDVDKLEIIARILKLVGVSLQAGQVEQYANMVTTQGQ
jgi:hypothetical protein